MIVILDWDTELDNPINHNLFKNDKDVTAESLVCATLKQLDYVVERLNQLYRGP